MIDDGTIEQIRFANHGDPFAILGLHTDPDGRRWLRAFLPGAVNVDARAADGETVLLSHLDVRHEDGFFEGAVGDGFPDDYRLGVRWRDGNWSVLDDPYRYPPVLGEMDVIGDNGGEAHQSPSCTGSVRLEIHPAPQFGCHVQ